MCRKGAPGSEPMERVYVKMKKKLTMESMRVSKKAKRAVGTKRRKCERQVGRGASPWRRGRKVRLGSREHEDDVSPDYIKFRISWSLYRL